MKNYHLVYLIFKIRFYLCVIGIRSHFQSKYRGINYSKYFTNFFSLLQGMIDLFNLAVLSAAKQFPDK